MGVVIIRAAACDAKAGKALAEALREGGLDAYFSRDGDEGLLNVDTMARKAVVVVWSKAAVEAADETALRASVNALARDELILATLDQGDLNGNHALPVGFRTFSRIDLSRWYDAGSDGPVRDLAALCQGVIAREAFDTPAPVRKMEQRAEIWNSIAVILGGIFSLLVMAGIAGSGAIGENVGTLAWAELVMAKGPAGWIPLSLALGASVLSGIAGWFAAIGVFAAAGLLSVRDAEVALATEDRAHDVALIHAPENMREADVFTYDLQNFGMSVCPNPAQGDEDPAWASAGARAIRQADLVVLMGTASAFRSERVRREVLTALHLGRPILPLLIDQTEIPKDLRGWLGGHAWLRINDRLGGLLGPQVSNAILSLLQRPTLLAAAGR